MKRLLQGVTVGLCVGGLLPSSPLRADVFVYPNKGQTAQQQEQDKFDCYNWAKQQTGFDPMARPTATAPPPTSDAPKGGLLRGGARGAAVGAVGGAIGGNAGKGAAIGAAGGAMIGGMRRRDQRRREDQAQAQWQQQQAATYEANRGAYDRAVGACLEGRGYTVR